jgi:hypothetical protein
MLKLIDQYGMNEERVVREYAEAEDRGDVDRKSNTWRYTAERYARALWRDGIREGWIGGMPSISTR